MTSQTLNRLLQGTVAVLFLAFAGQVGYQYWFNKSEPVLLATWAFEPRTLAEAKGLAKEVVEVTVTNIERADDLVVPAPGEPGGVERIAIEVVSMKVNGAMKGDPGGVVQLFRTAGLPVTRRDMPPMNQAPPRPKGAPNPPVAPTPFVENTINIHDDQAYKPGESYVMFLREGPQVTMRGQRVATKTLLNPSTRFRVEAGGKIDPVIPDGLGAPFKGRPLQQFRGDIQQVAEQLPIPGKLPGQLLLPPVQLPPGMVPGGIRPRGIEGGEGQPDTEAGEVEVPTEGTPPKSE